jgi:hypothetical protein
MCVLTGAVGRVSPRRATYFLLRRQEKVSKEKATLLSASLRFATGNLRCSQPLGVAQTRLTGSNSARPLIQRLLRSSAQPEGEGASHAPSLRSARGVSLGLGIFAVQRKSLSRVLGIRNQK